ncbi:MAG: DEAD/DEAH box helicase family protein [Myxococcaceae bacterium]|jgi:ATP-dependent helicase HepA|nr:DEAD/DEAH box helicase family protein [Myxococcaceae bacterium]
MGPALLVGMKVKYLPQPEWGTGHLLRLEEEGTRAVVAFPARENGAPILVSTKGGALVPTALPVGAGVRTAKGKVGVIAEEVEGGRGLRRYVITLDDGTDDELPETELRALPPRPDLVAMMKEGRIADGKNFLLRKATLKLDDERRNDAFGALLASRVMVKPHQVGVVQRVLSSRRPRFVLADEVGLGKTIEAGMVFSALRLAGLARRVLVVAPSHLTVQWLVELFHKFNHLFTLMDSERHQSSLDEQPTLNPWARFDFVVTSLELLQRSQQFRDEAGAPEAQWDLVIIDEAHHLKGEKAYEAAEVLAKNAWGLLLLTATPMQLDPGEYQSLLSLIDPVTAPSAKEFEARLGRQAELSKALRALLEGKQARAAVKELVARFPHDAALQEIDDPDEMLMHLAETYSLSDRLIRNRRARVGGFSARTLHVHPVKLPADELEARQAVLDALSKDGSVRGAALANLVRRLESSPAAFAAALASNKALVGLKVALPDRDAKFGVFVKLLRDVWAKEPGAKVLVFTEARDTLERLQTRLRHEHVEALAYHGELPMVERDRQVARFRDPEGPKVLLCTEVGGEGRNFQFAHHLVHYDLPWSPSTVEQRIGRLDRIGQLHDVQIHVFDVAGTFSADVLTVLRDAVGVFGETVGGLDAVLESVEPRLTELAMAPLAERAAYVDELRAQVSAARAQVKRAYDPLLDLRSFDEAAVIELVERAEARIDHEAGDDDSLDDRLWGLARDLDERLEETITELADRLGIRVDTDQEVDAFQCAFHFGHALSVEALPGFDITEERTVLGTFWRDTAVEQEEIEYFATGHPLVEALFGFVKDGPFGRNGARFLEVRGPLKARGVEVLFHLTPPEPADTTPGARVPSRQLARFLDTSLVQVAVVRHSDGKAKVDGALLETLDAVEGKPLKGPEALAAFPELPRFLDEAMALAERHAQARLQALKAAARQAIEDERDLTMIRVKLALEHQGVAPARIEQALRTELMAADRLLEALAGVKVTLDSACAFVVNR